MAWIPNVNPNELVLSQWGNTIRDHVVNIFATAAERTAAIPSPVVGMASYRVDAGYFEIYTNKSPTPGWYRPWNMPWGQIAELKPADVVVTGSIFLPGTSVALTVAGRRHLYNWTGFALKSDSTVGALVASVNIGGGPPDNSTAATMGPNYRASFGLRHTYTNLLGSVSVVGLCDNGQVSLAGMRVTVDDVGPA